MSIHFSFEKDGKAGLVRRVYDAILAEDVAFAGVFPWGCDADMTLDQIISWNQSKLDEDFVLGMDEHVSNDYRQVLFEVEPFSECRLYVYNRYERLSLNLIVPEHEVNHQNAGPLIAASRRVWDQAPVCAVESYGELGCSTGLADIRLGVPPQAALFAIIDETSYQDWYENRFVVEKLSKGYVLMPKEKSID